MPTCPICGEPAVAVLHHGDAKALRCPTLFMHVEYGRAFLHDMDWEESAPEDMIV